MGSTFGALSTALSGIYAARAGLDTTGQNVANSNTEGYSRQSVRLDSVGAPAMPSLHSTYDGAGSGVTVAEITRLRDAFLEHRGHTEHGRSSYLSTRSAILGSVESLLAEPGSNGLQAQMSEYWNAWHDLANRPGDSAARAQLLQRAATLVDGLGQAHNAMRTEWQARHAELQHVVAEVNTTATAIADLNAAIRRNIQGGINPSELQDKRDLLVMQLSDKVGATTKLDTHGVLNVFVGSTALVRGDTVNALQVTGGTLFDQVRAVPPTPVNLTWTEGGYPATVELGRVGGLLEGLNVSFPTNSERLDTVAAELATRVNAVHRTGYGADGVTGRDFFTGATADTIRVALTDKDHIAAAATAGSTLDGGKASQIAGLVKLTDGPDAKFRQVVVDLGVEAQTANRRLEIQHNITSQIDAAREAHAGVDVDEEMVNMLTFQRAYEGAARALTAVDQALDTLINRTGLVGR